MNKVRRTKKLVRDNVPDEIKRSGKTPVIRKLNQKEFLKSLNHKLTEEHLEFVQSFEIEELADVLEVVYAYRDALGVSARELEKRRQEKCKKAGAFKKRLFLEEIK